MSDPGPLRLSLLCTMGMLDCFTGYKNAWLCYTQEGCLAWLVAYRRSCRHVHPAASLYVKEFLIEKGLVVWKRRKAQLGNGSVMRTIHGTGT